ncbi:Uncharacterised protein [Bordetella pertussis]|nr:Uncharacterised protein [Bordetella pertussis]
MEATDRSGSATRCTKALARARCANDSTMGAWAWSRVASWPSVAGECCSWSKYSRQLSGTEPGLSRYDS